MRDSKPIGTYGVKDQDTLTMPMTIYVKTPDGKKVTIEKPYTSPLVEEVGPLPGPGRGPRRPCHSPVAAGARPTRAAFAIITIPRPWLVACRLFPPPEQKQLDLEHGAGRTHRYVTDSNAHVKHFFVKC